MYILIQVQDTDAQGVMMVERQSIDAMSVGTGGRAAGSPIVSRERLDGNWSVERVDVGEWRGSGNAGEAIVDEDDDRSKLLRSGIGVASS